MASHERGAADAVDDDIEVAAEMLGDSRGAQAAHQLAGRDGNRVPAR